MDFFTGLNHKLISFVNALLGKAHQECGNLENGMSVALNTELPAERFQGYVDR